MYKVLLVDDEFMISDGISSVVNWTRLGTELIGIAQDGLEALASIEQATSGYYHLGHSHAGHGWITAG
ncbi:hypothetical protein Q0F98_13660 [Paenibacillus amylolyticus]|nr:hypothetical protein Q0F98_13660 [Paenibacillus amylolyticus]